MPALIRTLRLRDLLFLFIGSVIGSGIFLSPGLILRQVNDSVGLSMLVWIAGGVMSLLGALTYAELAAANPEAGGLYCYIRDGFGRLPAFLYGWCLFLVISAATIAALARAFSQIPCGSGAAERDAIEPRRGLDDRGGDSRERARHAAKL
jgi:basic amino acid/polyamine antiporter, APA family